MSDHELNEAQLTGGDEAPGWDAVDSRVRERVPGLRPEEPAHWASDGLPGEDGLYGVTAYPAGEVWLYVTLGLTELFEKESDILDVSGWGFELTMRVARTAGSEPPTWPVAALQQLGAYVFSAASPFAEGHRIRTGELPISGPEPLIALAFTQDPELGEMQTPHGRVTFLTAVAVSGPELELMQSSSTAEVLSVLKAASPSFVVGVRR